MENPSVLDEVKADSAETFSLGKQKKKQKKKSRKQEAAAHRNFKPLPALDPTHQLSPLAVTVCSYFFSPEL